MENNNENENVKNILVLERARESEDSRHAKQLEVVEAVRTKNPELVRSCYAVGAWVWAEFQQKLSQEEVDFLKQLGFRWNPVRRVWQNACGGTEQLSSSHISYENFGKKEVSDVDVLCWHCQLGQKPKTLELPNNPEPLLLADLERFVAIRDIFAHVPVSWFAKDLEFDDHPRYKHFFNLDPKWKSIRVAINEFMNLQKEILVLITTYIKLVVLKREMFSKIFLGKSFNEILDEAKKQKNI